MENKRPNRKQYNKKQQNNLFENQDGSQFLPENEIDLQNGSETLQKKQNQTGRHGTNQFEKERRKFKSNINTALSNFYECASGGYMKIFKTLFNGVESWEILQFLGDYKMVLKFLKLLMDDRYLLLQISSFQKIDFTTDFLNESVPRTFICGLMRLRQNKNFIDIEDSLRLTQSQIKTLYFSCLMLVGVGQIDKIFKNQYITESSEAYYHRLVTYLLDQSSFFTPKLFYYIRQNWMKIIQIIQTQLEIDASKLNLKENNISKSVKNKNQFKIIQKMKGLNIKDQQQNKYQKNIKNQDLNIYEDGMNQESYEILKSVRGRQNDETIKFLSGSKPARQNKDFFDENPQISNKKRTRPVSTLKGQILAEKKVKLDSSYDPAVKKAIKYYNYCKYHTRDRRTKKQSKKQNKKMKQKQLFEQKEKVQVKEEIKSQYKPIQSENLSLYFQDNNNIDFIMNRNEENFDFGMEGKFVQEQIQSLGFGFDFNFEDEFSEHFGSSQDVQNRVNSQQILTNQKSSQQDEDSMSVESQMTKGDNPNRRVRHESREIDFMIDAMIENRFVMAHSIANQIYHSLKAANVMMVCEGSRNLIREFDQQY